MLEDQVQDQEQVEHQVEDQVLEGCKLESSKDGQHW